MLLSDGLATCNIELDMIVMLQYITYFPSKIKEMFQQQSDYNLDTICKRYISDTKAYEILLNIL